MDILTILAFIAGLALLIGGADMLVRGASRLAVAFGVSPVIIGLTVVAFGTGSPEMAISMKSGLAGTPNIALGNVIGSNICNVLIVLGLAAVAAPLIVQHRLVRFDVPVMLLSTLVVWWMAADGNISRVEGAILFVAMVGYTVAVLRASRTVTQPEAEDYAEFIEEYTEPEDETRVPWYKDAVFIVTGLGALILGSNWVVNGAVLFAETLGISDLIIALTVVAIGTSLPEIVTSVVAAMHGERDIAVGNVIGSNIFNILAVLGLVAAASGPGIAVAPEALAFDLPVMAAVAALCLPIFLTHMTIARWEGVMLLGFYAAYTAYLVLSVSASPALPLFGRLMVWLVFPATVVALAVSAVRGMRASRAASQSDPSASTP